jgi:hypothetical protein
VDGGVGGPVEVGSGEQLVYGALPPRLGEQQGAEVSLLDSLVVRRGRAGRLVEGRLEVVGHQKIPRSA